jgi:uracil-DNA glycosylase
MRMSQCIHCVGFPCVDVDTNGHWMPSGDVDPEAVRIVLISECPAADAADNYDAAGDPLFGRTTVQAFRDAGVPVDRVAELVNMGLYLTTAVKCRKRGPGICPQTIATCSHLLAGELSRLPNVAAYLLMGDVAIRAVNTIAKEASEPRVVPAGPTYKLRGQRCTFRGRPAFPSYLQAGPSFFIERSKRRMIAEDIAAAVSLL